MQGRRVAVTLGSGGARGYAHIGILEVLAERDYEVVAVSGTSMGALVGGLYAAGKLGEYAAWVRGLTQRDVLRMLDPTLTAPGVIRGEKIMAKVSELLGGTRIEDLEVPFTAVATDLLARREVWFQHGPLDAAIRASIAMPSVVTPVVRDGRLLADGALMNPLPIAATTGAGADLSIGVMLSHEDLLSVSGAPTVASVDGAAAQADQGGRGGRSQLLDAELFRTIQGWFGAGDEAEQAHAEAEEAVEEVEGDVGAGDDVFGALPPGLRTSDVMTLALDAMQSVVLRYRLAGYPPDLLITVPKASARTLDFHRAAEMIEVGRERATEVLSRYERRLEQDGPRPAPFGG